jgi:hypothetical protein
MADGMQISPELIAAYQATDYLAWCDGIELTLKIGARNGVLDALFDQLGASVAAFLTAWNPLSVRLGAAENAARQRQLRAELEAAGLVIWDGKGQGRDGEWPAEASYLIWGIERHAAMEMARRYGQNAFVWMQQGSAPILLFPS